MPLDTHAIVIGVVEDVHFGPRRPPLVHFDGGYTSVLAAFSENLS
jgi:flavin reductase (DIM6/NTAB) family NADH-FMN oxidoreductase RutF